jgi:hypothetical protein
VVIFLTEGEFERLGALAKERKQPIGAAARALLGRTLARRQRK